MTPIEHISYAAGWLAFALLHSLTAGAQPGRGLARIFGNAHRLAYNALAVVEIAAVLAWGAAVGHHARTFAMAATLAPLRWAMLVAGAVLLVAGMRSYRLGPFVGWAQLRGDAGAENQPLVIDGLHKRMRHPLYTAALLLLWGRVTNELGLATAMWGSLYLWIGSLFEERRLIAQYGSDYRLYRDRTPRFWPRLV